MKVNLTIIIPHYNTPTLLMKLIESIPDSDDIQIIVVDDNSTKEQNKYEEAKSLYSTKVEFYKNTTGIKSAGSCRNIGLDHAKGNWVLFADSDDYFLPNMYSIVKNYFDSIYDIVFFTPTSVFIDTGKPANRHVYWEKIIQNYIENPNEENTLALKSFRAAEPWSKLIKRKLIEQHNIRFSQSLYSNDIYFSAVVGYYAQTITASEKIIYCVTRNKGSLTMKMDQDAYDIRLEEHLKKCKFLIEHYGRKACRRQHIVSGAERLYVAVQQHYGIKKYFEIIKKFKEYDVPVFNINLLHPGYIFRTLKQRKLTDKQDKKYFVKEGD